MEFKTALNEFLSGPSYENKNQRSIENQYVKYNLPPSRSMSPNLTRFDKKYKNSNKLYDELFKLFITEDTYSCRCLDVCKKLI